MAVSGRLFMVKPSSDKRGCKSADIPYFSITVVSSLEVIVETYTCMSNLGITPAFEGSSTASLASLTGIKNKCWDGCIRNKGQRAHLRRKAVRGKVRISEKIREEFEKRKISRVFIYFLGRRLEKRKITSTGFKSRITRLDLQKQAKDLLDKNSANEEDVDLVKPQGGGRGNNTDPCWKNKEKCKRVLRVNHVVRLHDIYFAAAFVSDKEDELLRIEEHEGKAKYWNETRVLGILSMLRAIGDGYLRAWIIPVLEITFTTRTDEDEMVKKSGCGSNKITKEKLSQLPYLSAIFHKTLRRHSPVPLSTVRHVHEDTILGGYHVPTGTKLAVNIYGCNMDKNVWENPEVYNLDKFMKENETIDMQRTVAFGGGKRGCMVNIFLFKHICENMKAQWRGKQFKELVWKCASATTVPYFDRQIEKLKRLDEGAYEYLKKIPPQHWSKFYFSDKWYRIRKHLPLACKAYCDVPLNNLCEVFIRQLVDGRDVPIITCLEFVREYLMKKIVNVKNVISKSKGPLTPAATVLFDAIKYKDSFYTIFRKRIAAIENGSLLECLENM
nr:ent-kaurene oxidase, chloroplastic-like [Tanacetum cinerariifolium]